MFVSKIILFIFFLNFIKCDAEKLSIDWDIPRKDYFNGFMYKSSGYVRIYPEIKLKIDKNLKICHFILISKDGSELPFVANLKSPNGDKGEIVIRGPINLDKYTLYIKAKICNKNMFSREVKVVIKLADDELPKWEKSLYNAAVYDDSRLGAEVVKVRAFELGRSTGNSICDYKITAPIDAPFDIDGNGVIRTTNRLDARKHKNYVLRVTAIDCWMPNPRNSSISVNIEVKRVCKFGWNGIYEQINYQSSAGIKRLGRSVSFDNCNRNIEQCQDQEVVAHLMLHNPNTKMCDRDLWSLRHQWKSCELNKETTELLPSVDQFVREDHGTADAVTGIYTFDGIKTHWEIPTNIIASDHFLGNNFTFSFWMRHDRLPEDDKHKKEQILCNSDGNGKNRHHYSLFLHNCKLVFLYRTEPLTDTQVSSLSPAEWRFKSMEMCDRNWHHYSLIVETVAIKASTLSKAYPSRRVKLYIDGALFPSDIDNPEIIDDMPMHVMPEVRFTKLAIGACWHAKSSSYIQNFKGQLAGITVLRGKSESSAVIECINQCHERLAFTGINRMGAGTSISINSLMSSMTVTAASGKDVAKTIEQMGYINSRWNPIPGKRTIELSTIIKCSNGIKFDVPSKITTIVVMSKDESGKQINHSDEESHGKEYALHVNGNELIEIDSQHMVTEGIGSGIPILPNIMINDVTNDGLGSLLLWGKPTAEGNRKQYMIKGVSMIESCMLHVHPPLNKQQEYLAFTNSIIEDLSDQGIYLNVTNSSLGLLIEGGQSVSIYRFVLQRIVYFNSQLDQFQEKLLKLVCSKNSAHSVSNELVIKLRLSPHVKASLKKFHSNKKPITYTVHRDVPFDDIGHKAQSEMGNVNVRSSAVSDLIATRSSRAIVIISVCCVLIIVVTILVLLRISRRRLQKLSDPYSRSIGGPWVRLKPHGLKFPFSKKSSLCNIGARHVPVLTPNGEMEWDHSEIYTNSLMEDSLQITVNPMLEHEKAVENLNVTNSLLVKLVPSDQDDRSLEGLPDEYDGRSEDFRDIDDEMTVEDDTNSINEDTEDNIHFYQNGKSFSHNAIHDSYRDGLGSVNIHQNPRYNSLTTKHSK